MSFSEKIKLEVKQRANFRCCRCQNIGVQVHHIVPQKDGGSDDIDNAAPLCPTCHDYFGGNPDKRKEIIQMRDWWFQKAVQMFYQTPKLPELEQKIGELVLATQENTGQLANLQSALKDYNNEIIDTMTLPNSGTIASGIVNSTFPALKVSAHENVKVTDESWAVATAPPETIDDTDE